MKYPCVKFSQVMKNRLSKFCFIVIVKVEEIYWKLQKGIFLRKIMSLTFLFILYYFYGITVDEGK